MENPLHTQPQHWVNRLGFALRRDLLTRFRAAGITASAEEWGAMLILSQGPCTPSTLSDHTLRDRTTVTRLIDRLVDRGLVLRKTDPSDRRRVVLRLSRQGYTDFDAMARIAGSLVEDCNRGIDADDIARTTRVLERMLTNITDPNSQGDGDG